MFYETAQTVGPTWHRSYKPSHYEDMTWSPSTHNQKSTGPSPETYRRIVRNDSTENPDDSHQCSNNADTTRRLIKELWGEDRPRPRIFKRVFRPGKDWDNEDERDLPSLRRVQRDGSRIFSEEFPRSTARRFRDDFEDRNFRNEFDRPSSRCFDDEDDDDDFDRRTRDLKKDLEDRFEEAEGRVHHIPIMVERRIQDLKSRFRPTRKEENEDFPPSQVHRSSNTYEPAEVHTLRSTRRRVPNVDHDWDPSSVHTLPTRKVHKSSQSFDDSRHPAPIKQVYRSHSETNEDLQKPQHHSAAFRSHSDGHCPKKTHITRINIQLPSQRESDETAEKVINVDESNHANSGSTHHDTNNQDDKASEEGNVLQKSKSRVKVDLSPAMQQISVVLQNVEDLVGRVESYTGTGRDKQFRFLDEMLTRCMLRLDDIDTEGRDDVRFARKEAIKTVQGCVDLLEAKADEMERKKSKSNELKQNGVSVKNDPAEFITIPEVKVVNAIPPGNKPASGSIPAGNESDKHIPMEGVSNNDEKEEVLDEPKVCDNNVPIPLGHVPHISDCKDPIPLMDVPQICESKNGNPEQTKL